jgi:hypothetical protein
MLIIQCCVTLGPEVMPDISNCSEHPWSEEHIHSLFV